MCGINGALIAPNQSFNFSVLESLRDSLTKRGPDACGSFESDNIYLGHRRLSIIDLTTGDQPMFSEDGKTVLVFNGEIYNFQQIRNKLEQEDCQFKTTSDTEVVLMAYLTWGLEGCLTQLEGMFAFAIWDDKRKKLLIARDRFGEKPLYYTHNKEGFYFASELKALEPILATKEIDISALNLFLSLTYIPAPYTIYRSVRKLMPAEVIEIDQELNVHKWNYFDLLKEIKEKQQYTDYQQAQQELRIQLEESVKLRMISDVPLGSFLSGGIDSSIISALMAKHSSQPINTFSIGFEEKAYDESERADLVAKHIGANHTLYKLKQDEFLELIDEVIHYFDEPFADSSALPSFMVAKKARQKVTVVLTGDCADELFAGYEKYQASYYTKKFKKMPRFFQHGFRKIVRAIPHSALTNHLLRKVKKVMDNADKSPFELHYSMMQMGFSDALRQSLVNKQFYKEIQPQVQEYYNAWKEGEELNKGFYTDINLVLEGDMLTKVDRMCMMNSLEARVPFLDSKIVINALRMPVTYKIDKTNKKKILKETFADLLPEEVFKFSKKGFGVPIALWFRNELKTELLETLSEENLKKHNFFNYEQVSQLINEHLSAKENHSARLWTLFVFQKWYNKHMILSD